MELNKIKSFNTITTDASIYEIEPSELISPISSDDLVTTIRKLILDKRSFTLRAGGTSIGGQAIGNGVLIDVSKYLTNIVSLSLPNREVIVEPGVIQEDLNDFLKPYNLKFAPDTATANRAMIGGMIGNNSCGSYSVLYGSTREHVQSVEVVLSDGTLTTFEELDEIELREKLSLKNREGEIYRFIINLLSTESKDILNAFPDESLIRRNTGYALDILLRNHQPFNPNGKKFNLAPLICGSEGTLGVVVRAKLKLVELPNHKGLMVGHFSSDLAAFSLINRLLEHTPAAVEYMDKLTLDASKGNIQQACNRSWIKGNPESVLIIEFFSDTQRQLDLKMRDCKNWLLNHNCYHVEVLKPNEQYKVWEIRKAGLGLLMGKVGPKKALTVIEDAAVPIKHLYSYYQHMKKYITSQNTSAVYYGHASVGLIHIRPLLNLTNVDDRTKMLNIAKESSKTVKRFKGSLSGEHGDGRIRSAFLREQFGENIYKHLVDLKKVFDPYNLFNPGVIISDQAMLSNLRGVKQPTNNFDTILNWSNDISFFYAAEKCNGAGVCRQSVGRGIMCPSYKATREDRFSTRGRANLLRRALDSNITSSELKNNNLEEALDLCLGCKACKRECPANVDMTKLKSEYLFQTQKNQNQFELWYIKNLGRILKFGSYIPNIFNIFKNNYFVMKAMGFHRQSPALQSGTLSSYWKNNQHNKKTFNRTVWILCDIFTEYFDLEKGKELLLFLEACEVNIKLVPYTNSVVAMISKGLLIEAREELEDITSKLANVGEDDLIMGVEPSETLVWRDEAKDLLTNNIPKVHLFEELIIELENRGSLPKLHGSKSKVWLFTHCHQKTLTSLDNLKQAMKLIPDIEYEIVNAGCCGMAGDFGYKNPEISEKIAHQSLDGLIKKIQSNDVLISAGVSCRNQFLDIYSYNAKQLHQIFYESII